MEIKCLKKANDYFNDPLNDNNPSISFEYNNDHVSSIYELFINEKQKTMKKFISNINLINDDLSNLKKTIENVINVISECKKNKKMLVVGQVQSGKTDFMIGLISKLIDINNKKDKESIFLCLTTSNTSLSKQTKDRFEDFFYKKNKSNVEVDIYDKEFFDKEKKSEIKNKIFILMKNKKHLENFLNWVNLYTINKNINLYILDDEGDNASFNTNVDDFDNKTDLSTINNLINSIISKNDNYRKEFISITATPFIHFFSYDDVNLKPEFAFLLHANNGYYGIFDFNEEVNKKKSRLIKIIKENYSNEIIEYNESLQKAILTFILQTAIISFSQEQEKNYFSLSSNESFGRMMINISIKNEIQNEVADGIEKWIFNLINNKDEETLFNLLENKKIFDEFSDIKDENDKKNICLKIKTLIAKRFFEVCSFNATQTNNELNFDKANNKKAQIIVGGIKLSRGISIKDLINVFMSYRPKIVTADILLQRARWFGYNKNRIDKMRIFITKELLEDYSRTSDLVSNLFNLIKDNENNEFHFKKMEKFLSVEKYSQNYDAVNNRVKTQWSTPRIKNIFMRNKAYKNESYLDYSLFSFFDKEWNKNKKFNLSKKYPILEIQNFKKFKESFFNNDEEFFELFDVDKYNKDIFKNNDWFSNKKLILRFINLEKNLKNINFRDRIVVEENLEKDEFIFGQGNYAEEYSDINQETIKIDLIPLNIWKQTKDEKQYEIKIIRARLFLPKEDKYYLNSKGIRTI